MKEEQVRLVYGDTLNERGAETRLECALLSSGNIVITEPLSLCHSRVSYGRGFEENVT